MTCVAFYETENRDNVNTTFHILLIYFNNINIYNTLTVQGSKMEIIFMKRL